MAEKSLANQRVVVKVGSSLVTKGGKGVDMESIRAWAAQIAELTNQGCEVVLVSSGAIAEGMKRLKWAKRPKEIHELQAAAAVGQMGLVHAYEIGFAEHGLVCAQVLLTHADLADRERYLNARSTLYSLLGHKVVPIINENDTVVTDEIRFGDNDTLSALVAAAVDAEQLILLTDVDRLYSADPRLVADARPISDVHHPRELDALEAVAGDGGRWGRGGMVQRSG